MSNKESTLTKRNDNEDSVQRSGDRSGAVGRGCGEEVGYGVLRQGFSDGRMAVLLEQAVGAFGREVRNPG